MERIYFLYMQKNYYITVTFFSHLNYCLSTWGPMVPNQQLNKLQKIQDQCIDLIDLTRTPIKEKYKINRILDVKQLIELECSKLGYRIINELLPNNLLKIMTSDQSGRSLKKAHSYSTRQKESQISPKYQITNIPIVF